MLVYYKVEIIIISSNIICSRHDKEKIILASTNNKKGNYNVDTIFRVKSKATLKYVNYWTK
jgi:hypothetical protein